ncbi:MAG TPA: CBS domain-containing protein [Burkholderiales bacterium]|jgi:CBS domain-containing protein|nr:CBS domain-containing protein [Burkholderiales bacterium]
MQLKEIMTKPVETVAPTASLVDAARKMLVQDIGALPVYDEQRVVGIITDRDIAIRAIANGLDPADTKVQEIMTNEVFSCDADSDVEDACQLMEEKQIRRLIVTDDQQGPIGIVSLGDMALQLREEQSGEVLKEVSQPE